MPPVEFCQSTCVFHVIPSFKNKPELATLFSVLFVVTLTVGMLAVLVLADLLSVCPITPTTTPITRMPNPRMAIIHSICLFQKGRGLGREGSSVSAYPGGATRGGIGGIGGIGGNCAIGGAARTTSGACDGLLLGSTTSIPCPTGATMTIFSSE